MKKLLKINFILLFFLMFTGMNLVADAQEDSVTAEEITTLKYHNENNSLHYLIVESVLKKGKVSEPVKDKSLAIYLDSVAVENLVGNVKTNENGISKSFIPVSLKTTWDASPLHKFIVVAPGKEDESVAEIEIVKSRMSIDTSSSEGIRSITVLVEKYENDAWVPVNEAEMKIGIRRLGSILSAGDDATYTTDSTGMVTIEVTRDSLPGDSKGNIILAAHIEDNDMIGNLLVEKPAAWGVPAATPKNFFEQRTLWSTGNRTPLWLLFMAYGIIIIVWGTLIYLVFQLIKIKKLGKESGS